ncbi:MAG: transposase [Candidatus Marinimicrobia bacterium]|nr:transposase [Candidatus Neomarinimicrobiota bacterium]
MVIRHNKQRYCTMPYHQQHPAVLMLVANRKDVAKIIKKNAKNVKGKMGLGILSSAIMPNHVHAIIVIYPDDNIVGARHASPLQIYKSKIHGPKSNSIGSIVSSLKSAAAKQINESQNTPGRSIWQRNYYEHIIRDEHELNKIRRYIINNPPQWEYDRENQNGLPIDEKQKFWSKFLNEFD